MYGQTLEEITALMLLKNLLNKDCRTSRRQIDFETMTFKLNLASAEIRLHSENRFFQISFHTKTIMSSTDI